VIVLAEHVIAKLIEELVHGFWPAFRRLSDRFFYGAGHRGDGIVELTIEIDFHGFLPPSRIVGETLCILGQLPRSSREPWRESLKITGRLPGTIVGKRMSLTADYLP
jgi:hypothetical protein